jgi:DNA-binding CsgD family transcriptional regulator
MLIGREQEVARIEKLLDDARAGRSGALLVRGEPGIGKTSLLLHARAAASDMRVLVARGIQAESELPFSGLADLAGPLLDLRERLPSAQSMALGQALALEDGGTPARFAVPAALLGLLATAAEEGPVLVLADDLQWLDAPTVEAIVFTARRLRDEGIAMILGARTGTGIEVDASGLEELCPGPLDPDAAIELLRREHGTRLRGSVAGELAAAAAGNPLALVELPGSLSNEQLSGRQPLPPVLPAGQSVEAAFRQRLAALPSATREALLVVAAGRDETVTEISQALAALGLEPRALDPAESADIVAVDGGVVRFRHPLLRAAAYHLATPSERRHAHRALADVAPEGTPGRAWHLAAAVVAADESVAKELEAAAADARRRGGHGSAARAFARAAELTPEVSERARRLMEAAVESQAAGDFDQAEALADQGLKLDTDPMMRALLQRIRAAVQIRSGRPESGMAEMIEAASAVEDTVPVAAAVMWLEAGLARMTFGPVPDGVRLGLRARELASGDESLEALADVVVGQALMASGEAVAAEECFARREEQLVTMVPPPGASDIIVLAAHGSMWLEQDARAERILASVIDRARAEGALAALAYPLAVRAQLRLRQGRYSVARADSEEAARAAADTGQDTMLAYALAVRVHVEGVTGNTEEARAFADEAVRLLDETETKIFRPYIHSALGAVALVEDDPERAVVEYERARDSALAMGFTIPGQDIHSPLLVEAYLRAGDRAAAVAEYRRIEAMMGPVQPHGLPAQMARMRALLAPDDEAIAAFQEALAHHDGSPDPFERACTNLALGERLRRIPGAARDDAKAPLRAALEAFERLGAKPWAARARDELRGSGVTSRREGVAVAELLTPHEMQVAMVVAGGATNKEAAAALFLSPKTVEHHLGAIYKKLQVRSRTELSALVSQAA